MITAAALAVAMMLGTGCIKKPEVGTSETVTSQASAEEATGAPETTIKAPETTEQAAEAKEVYHMLQGTVTGVTEDEVVFTLQANDGRDYDISQSGIQDVGVEIDENVQIAIVYIREPLDRPENATLVVAPPEQEERSILTRKGTTTANAISSLTMKTGGGRELSFLKDNCPMEEGALAGDSGDKVTVTCVDSQGINYPVRIKGTE